MSDIKEYISLFASMPLAVIQMYFIYKIMTNHQEFIKEVLKIIKRKKNETKQ